MPLFQQYYSIISGGREQVSLNYVSHCQRGPLLEVIQRDRFKDRAVGYSLHGVHRDDLEMMLDGHPMKREGSQGQLKTYVIALKLAQFEFLKRSGNKTTPLLCCSTTSSTSSTPSVWSRLCAWCRATLRTDFHHRHQPRPPRPDPHRHRQRPQALPRERRRNQTSLMFRKDVKPNRSRTDTAQPARTGSGDAAFAEATGRRVARGGRTGHCPLHARRENLQPDALRQSVAPRPACRPLACGHGHKSFRHIHFTNHTFFWASV